MRLGGVTIVLLVAFFAMGIIGLGLDYGFVGVDMSRSLQLPNGDALLGTDRLGRDLLPRVFVATRGFFLPGLLAAAIAAAVGISLGAFAGYAPRHDGVDARSPAVRLAARGARSVTKLLLALPAALPRFVSIVLLLLAPDYDLRRQSAYLFLQTRQTHLWC